MTISAIRYDQKRSAVLAHLNDASTRMHARLMQMEKDGGRETSPDVSR